MNKRWTTAAVPLILLAGACGGDDSATETTGRAPLTTAAPAETPTTPPKSSPATVPPTTAVPATTSPSAASTWTPATSNLEGLPSECGNLSSVFTRADRDEVIAGVALQGLWSSIDGSDTWVQLGTGPGSDAIINRPTALIVDPTDPNRWWESGIYQGGGVYRTDDAGATFQQLGDVVMSDLVSVDLSDPERRTLLSGTHEQAVVFRSSDGGETWQDVSAGLPAGIGFASLPHVIDAQTYVLGTNEGPESGIFRTTDAGATWTRVHSGPVSGRPLVSPDGTVTWLVRFGGGLVRSTDGGMTWTEVPSTAIDRNAEDLVLLPDGRLATLGGSTIVASADGGATWTSIGAALPYAPAGVAYAPLRQAFYIWKFDCDFSTDNPIPADAIMRLDFAVS